MNGFEPGNLRVDVLDREPGIKVQLFSIVGNLVFFYKRTGLTMKFEVPDGTVTDFASVPWFLQWLCSPFGEWNKAAILHDHLCNLCTAGEFDRFQADAIFRFAMKLEGVPLWRRVSMYYAVRCYAVLARK